MTQKPLLLFGKTGVSSEELKQLIDKEKVAKQAEKEE